MGLLVVTEQVEVDDRQPAGDVDHGSDVGQITQQDGDCYPGRYELQFLEEIMCINQAAHEIDDCQHQLHCQQHGGAHKAVEITEDQQR